MRVLAGNKMELLARMEEMLAKAKEDYEIIKANRQYVEDKMEIFDAAMRVAAIELEISIYHSYHNKINECNEHSDGIASITLSDRDRDQLLAALANPPEPTEALRKTLEQDNACRICGITKEEIARAGTYVVTCSRSPCGWAMDGAFR
jgi:hypothetical protein